MNYGETGYGDAGPHALTSIEGVLSSYEQPPQAITYNCFNKVNTIQDTIGQDTTLTLSFTYGLNNNRVKTLLTRNSTVKKVKYFNGDYEEDSTSNGIKKYHYINAPTGLVGIFVSEGSADTLFHVLTDHLGSLTGAINEDTDDVTYYSYNAWGVPRDPEAWASEFEGELFAGRGYTGHEHLMEFDLINMNGRVYDPVIARFLSPDPFVQFPGMADGYNRYSYVMNNPLMFTDPSGYMPDWVQDEYDHYYRNGGGGGGGFNYFGWINSGMQQGWTQRSSPYGGWEYNWSTGKYERYSGETMSATDFFYNTPYLSSSRYVRQPTEVETQNAYTSLTGTSVEYLPGSDLLGSKMAIFTRANGTVSAGPVSFWKISGNYYNHLYYFSGLAAYSPNEAFRFAQKYRNGGTPFTRGGSLSLTAMFAFGGGWQFELGVVWDHHGGRKAYFNTGPTVGYDYSAGIQIKEITGYNRFDADMYGGFNTSIDVGIGPIDLTLIGGDNEFDRYHSEFRTLYEECGWGVSLGSPLGFSWQMGNTTIF